VCATIRRLGIEEVLISIYTAEFFIRFIEKFSTLLGGEIKLARTCAKALSVDIRGRVAVDEIMGFVYGPTFVLNALYGIFHLLKPVASCVMRKYW